MAVELLVKAQYAQDADTMFEKASSFADMIDVTRKLLTFHGLPALPMVQGRTYKTDVRFFGLPMAQEYEIRIDTLCKHARRMQSSERSDSVRCWKHTLDVVPHADGALWTDHVIIDAGWRTPVIARFARFMYLHRHTQRAALSMKADLQKCSRHVVVNAPVFHPGE